MMPAGTYLVGDLCYVMHPQWDEVCELLFANRTDRGCNQGEFTLKNGVKFAIYNTAYGDGTYPDQWGNTYPVDAGCIGCIRVEDVTDPDAWLEGMTQHTFDKDFETSTDGERIEIGDVCVDTGWEEPAEEEEYDEEEC
jgi:hypothetical protein